LDLEPAARAAIRAARFAAAAGRIAPV